VWVVGVVRRRPPKANVSARASALTTWAATGWLCSHAGALELTRRISGDGEAAARPSLEALAPGDVLGPCFVQQVGADFLWAALSPTLRARVFVLDAADDVATLQHFGSHFKPGQRLDGATVLARDLARRTLDLTLRKEGGAKLKVGAVVPGRVTKLLPGVGLNVQLGARKFGRVHLTDLRDVWTDAPLQGVTEGQFVRCAVAHAGDKIDLSLRASRGGCEAGGAASKVRGQTHALSRRCDCTSLQCSETPLLSGFFGRGAR